MVNEILSLTPENTSEDDKEEVKNDYKWYVLLQKKKIKQGTEVDTMGGNGNESENERRGKGLYFRWGCWGRCPCIDGIFKQKLY